MLETPRLKLQSLCTENAGDLFLLRSNKDVVRHVDKSTDKSIEDTIEFMDKIITGVQQQKWYYWGIISNEHKALVGTICLWMFNDTRTEAEIGFELHPSYQKKGYMTEATAEILEFGFNDLHLNCINAFTQIKNRPAINLLKNFKFELRQIIDNEVIYSLDSPNTTP
jgi:ribosomal-protein-alanine N-acetyltransferase